MKNDVGSTRWARELNERDVRLMREQNTPAAERHLLPKRKVAWALIVAVVFWIGAAIGELAHWVFG